MKHLVHPPTRFCSECKGECCERAPAPYHPSDLKKVMTVDYLLELLEAKKVVISWDQKVGVNGVRAGKATYYLRPPSVGDNGHFIRSWDYGPCVFLTESGCSLPYEDKPLGCRNLKPSSDYCCKCTYGQYQAFRSWAKYRRVIEEVIDIIDRRRKGDFSR